MKVRVPKEIKIGIHKYRIYFRPNLILDENHYGICSDRQQIIVVDPVLPATNRYTVLLHEIIHAVKWSYGVDICDADIDRLAEGLAVFLFDGLGLEFDWSNIEEE